MGKEKNKVTSESKTVELYRRYRPKNFDELVGQDEVADMVEAMLESSTIPHCILAAGPSGTGKTTTFRILRNLLKCSDLDFKEHNAASLRGIDFIREIQRSMNLRPIQGDCKVFLIDECHQLTSEAQEAILKLLEDTPSHVYFFLASTSPQSLKRTIITRSTVLNFRPLSKESLVELVRYVFKTEKKIEVPVSIANEIAEQSEGSARQALVLLHQIINMDMEDHKRILEVLKADSNKQQAIEICRALLSGKKWNTIAAILRDVKDSPQEQKETETDDGRVKKGKARKADPEQIRRMILGYMEKVALSGGKMSGRACAIIDLFRDNFYDSGYAGLVSCCYAASLDN